MVDARPAEPVDAPEAELPFEPPPGFAFPAALQAPVPRDKPPGFARSSHVRRRRQIAMNTAFGGLACILIADLPFIKQIGWFFSPFQVLVWIGLGLIALAGIVLAMRTMRDERLAVFRKGEPRVARLRDIMALATTINNSTLYQFSLNCDVENPSTGEIERRTITSRDKFSERQAKRMSLSIAPGEYTTALAMPDGRTEIYGLLGIDPEHEMVRRDGRPLEAMSIAKSLLVSVLVLAGVLTLLGVVFAIMFLTPVDGANHTPVIVGCVVGGGLVLAVMLAYWMRHRASPNWTRRRWVAAFIGFPLLSAMPGAGAALVANAALDRSPGRSVAIEIEQFKRTTHKALFHEYSMDYHRLPNGAKEHHTLLPTDMVALAQTNVGVLDIGAGGLGMEWMRGVRPAVLCRSSDAGVPADAPLVQVVERDPGGGEQPVRRALCIRTRTGALIAPPAELAEYWRRMEREHGAALINVDEKGADIPTQVEF